MADSMPDPMAYSAVVARGLNDPTHKTGRLTEPSPQHARFWRSTGVLITLQLP